MKNNHQPPLLRGTSNKIGSVMVVGGGITGLQSALDLAESGYKVYLLERTSAIGGNMSALDKTFPTGDCSMCMISPRLVEVSRHRNIQIITNAEIAGVTGQAGAYQVSFKKHPRYVIPEKCNACGDCSKVCPVQVNNDFNQNIGQRTAIGRRYAQAVPNTFDVIKKGTSPCRMACPADVNAHAYVALIAQRKYPEALEVVRRVLPFPSVCGRLCHHPCETECNRGEVDKPIAIRPLKRFIADTVRERGEQSLGKLPVTRSEKIAVIGAGPAGLSCALRLKEKGYAVTIFEAADKAGGMMTLSVPEYRTPEAVVQYDIKRILDTGIEIKFNTRIGRDIPLAKLREDYQAIFAAVGCPDPARLPLEGSEANGVLYGLSFLKDAKRGQANRIKDKRVTVIGGGNVAIDCARSAVRLGAKEVTIACLETRDMEHKDRMPAHLWEIEEAEGEGVRIKGSLCPKKIITANGQVSGLELARCESVYEISPGGKKFAPKICETERQSMETDVVIIAIGQRANLAGFEEIEKTPAGLLKTDAISRQTNIPNVFAGGDIASGPASVIEAVAQGNEAAISIDRFLNKQDLKAGRLRRPQIADLPEGKIPKKKRIDPPVIPVAERRSTFNEIELNYPEESAVAEAQRCLNCAVCCECFECVKACKPEAIDHQMIMQEAELKVGSIILSPGVKVFNAEQLPELGLGRYKNVVSSLQFERILSASGPYRGEVKRPSDGHHPKRIAFIQCVGSRDVRLGRNYCSGVCCMYATKQAIVARDHLRTQGIPDDDITCNIFFIDLRAYGKGFDRYVERAQQQYGIKFIRSSVSSVKEDPATGDLFLKYVNEKEEIKTAGFDLVVLSVGLEPSPEGVELAKKLGLELNQYCFPKTDSFRPVETNREGILVAGAFSGPKDIPESVMQGSAVAGAAAELLAEVRGTEVTKKSYPPEIELKDPNARIGVFVCCCGINIASVVDVKKVADSVRSLPGVVHSEVVMYACSSDNQAVIKKAVAEHHLNRVIVASCSPRTHEPLFQETIREVGLNKQLFEMTNIREQCAWVHFDRMPEATAKAESLLKMTIQKSALLECVPTAQVSVIPAALVLGGGLSGMTAALSLAKQGFEVALVEKEPQLGGYLRNTFPLNTQRQSESRPSGKGGKGVVPFPLDEDANIPEELTKLVNQVEANPRIHLHLNTELKELGGYIGNFQSVLKNGATIKHGVVVVATGGREYLPTEYEYGKNQRVITQSELEKHLKTEELKNEGIGSSVSPFFSSSVASVAMIQCVGSRIPERPYCSRVCCTRAIKNALALKRLNPSLPVFILYRDIRTYGFKEDIYRAAREAGVIFIRYELEQPPQILTVDGQMKIKTFHHILQKEIVIPTDLLVLSTGIVPAVSNSETSKILKVPLDQDGFFLEAHVKLRPVDFANEGIFLCGLAHSPKFNDENIIQSKAAAARAGALLGKGEITVEKITACVTKDLCASCLTCIRMCPYEAIRLDENNKAEVQMIKCQGCGICAAECPAKAIQLPHFTDAQITAMEEALSKL